ncbi:hypothetical protein ACW9KT_15520 [Hymenobacter sp. HD11105]
MSPAATRRRPYSRSDYHYLRRHYGHSSATSCARALGRTVGSLKYFINAHPELKKRGHTGS